MIRIARLAGSTAMGVVWSNKASIPGPAGVGGGERGKQPVVKVRTRRSDLLGGYVNEWRMCRAQQQCVGQSRAPRPALSVDAVVERYFLRTLMALRGELPLQQLPEERVSAHVLPAPHHRDLVLVREAPQPASPAMYHGPTIAGG
jgi:hypothetical protein